MNLTYLAYCFGGSMKFKVLALGALISVNAYANTEIKEINASNLSRMELSIQSSQVTIKGIESSIAKVTTTKHKFSDKCELKIEKVGRKLIVAVNKTGIFALNDCKVDFLVEVPKAIDLELKVGSGQVKIEGIDGELDYLLGSGDLIAEGKFSEIEGKSGSGSVTVKGLTGGGDIKIGSGRLNLTFATTLLKGELDVKTGSGDAELVFPKGSKVRTSFRAGRGELLNELGDVADAPFRVSMKSGSGDLNIKSY
jgi:DUF4097 and DUF4098 domain-containing protein YvlB